MIHCIITTIAYTPVWSSPDDGEELEYVLSDEFGTQGASGAPLLNDKGKWWELYWFRWITSIWTFCTEHESAIKERDGKLKNARAKSGEIRNF